MKRAAVAAVLGLVLAAPRGAMAQAPIAGSWSTEFDIGIRNENGVETSMGKRQATMTLTVKGDSVVGTWQVAADGGAAPAPVRLRGTRTGNKVVLRADPVTHTVNVGDGDRTVKMVAIYRLEVRGDWLEGTSQNTADDGSLDGPERQFSAKRVKL